MELMSEREATDQTPFYPPEEILKEYSNFLSLTSKDKFSELRLLEAIKKFKLENDLDCIEETSKIIELDNDIEEEDSKDDSYDPDNDLDLQIDRVVLPVISKKVNLSGKPWWDAGRNRLGETELQRKVIDLKLTDEPQEKLEAIENLIRRGHPVNVCDNTG